MTSTPISTQQTTFWQKHCRKLIDRYFKEMSKGRLIMHWPNGDQIQYGQDENYDPAIIRIQSEEFFVKCVLYGDIGLGESYVDGDWETEDISAVVAWFILNVRKSPSMSGSAARSFLINCLGYLNRFGHRRRANTLENSKKNIHEHYDLGNKFYELFLDETMTYSCAYFQGQDESLEMAQTAKYDRLCKKLKLGENDHVLEIGCGWGGFAEHAASRYGCKITGITISEEQLKFAKDRIKKAGLDEKVTLQFKDYRHLEGQFDKIVSIEMLEAVGDDFLEDYFEQCNRLLKPEGLLGLQIITCPDSRYEQLKRGTDWSQKHIFPGSLLLAQHRVAEAMEQVGSLFLHSWEEFSHNYARTLKSWHERFNASLPEVRAQGFDETFIRKWNYYLEYCHAGFNMRNVGVAQAIYTRPNNLSLREPR